VSNNKVTKLKPRSKPAAALDTPTDLDPAAVKAVSEALNRLLADAFALYLKTKNFHWHVSGPHFRDYHLMLDEQAADIFAATDDMAERVRKIGGTTLRSIGHIAKLQTKLREARARQNAIAARFESAVNRARASEMLNGNRTEDAFSRFEVLERRADFAEGRADALGMTGPKSLEEEIAELKAAESVDAELEAMKAALKAKGK